MRQVVHDTGELPAQMRRTGRPQRGAYGKCDTVPPCQHSDYSFSAVLGCWLGLGRSAALFQHLIGVRHDGSWRQRRSHSNHNLRGVCPIVSRGCAPVPVHMCQPAKPRRCVEDSMDVRLHLLPCLVGYQARAKQCDRSPAFLWKAILSPLVAVVS